MKKWMMFFFSLLLLLSGMIAYAQEEQMYPVRAKVVELLEETGNEVITLNGDFYAESQFVKVRIMEGEDRGETVVAEHSTTAYFSDYPTFRLEKGDRVFVTYQVNRKGNLTDVYVTDIVREGTLYLLIGLFALLILILGRGKGFKTIITLAVTIVVVIKALIPLILKGYSPIGTAVVLCSGIVILCFFVISGWRIKTVAAILGTMAGVISAGVLAWIAGSLAHLTGLAQEETLMLMSIPQDVQIDFKGLLFAGIIIGAMGAVMDVGMSIASALNELKETNPETSFRQLVRSGMNIGRDVMGTMTNTLILAYTGGAINLLLIFTAYEVPFAQIINGDHMASEIVRALAGSIGLVLTIPVTTVVSAWLYSSKLVKGKRLQHENL